MLLIPATVLYDLKERLERQVLRNKLHPIQALLVSTHHGTFGVDYCRSAWMCSRHSGTTTSHSTVAPLLPPIVATDCGGWETVRESTV